MDAVPRETETVDFLFNFLRDAPERQLKAQEAIDSKIVSIFSAASITLGLGGVSSLGTGDDTGRNWLLAAAILFYVAGAVACGYAVWKRKFRVTRHADYLWDDYAIHPVADVKGVLLDDTRDSYRHNRKLLRKKGRALVAALVAVSAEVVLVAAALISSAA